MRLILLAILVTVANAQNGCTGVYINNQYYNLDIMKEGINRIHDLVLNRNDNIAYFTFEQIAKVPTMVLGYFNMNNKEAGLIEGIRNATALAIDQQFNKVYVGGSEGIYRINNKVLERMPVSDNIQSMFFKTILYFTNKRNEAYAFEDGYVDKVSELQGVRVEKLIIDDEDSFFFTEGKTLFNVKRGTRAVNSHEKYVVDVLTTDKNFIPYIATNKGLYVYNKYKYVFDRVSSINSLRALTFNKLNEPVYAVVDLLVRLSLSSIGCFGD